MRRMGLPLLLWIVLSSSARAEPTPLPPLPAPCNPIVCPCEPLAEDAELAPLKRELAAGIAILAASYGVTTAYALTLPRRVSTVDAIPLAGGVVSAARDDGRDRNAGLLLLGAWTQAVGLMVATAAGVEIAAHRRAIELGFVTIPGSGGMVTLAGRFH